MRGPLKPSGCLANSVERRWIVSERKTLYPYKKGRVPALKIHGHSHLDLATQTSLFEVLFVMRKS